MPEITFISKINDEGAVELFKKIGEAIEGVNEKAEETSSSWQKMAGQFAIAGASMVATGAAIGASLYEITMKASETGAQMLQLSQRTGIATDQLSALGYAAKLHGGDMDTITTATRGLAKGMSDLSSANSPAKKALEDLGIATVDASGKQRDMLDVMLDVSDAFAKMPDGANKAADAQAIFTRSGGALIPMLNGGSAAIKEEMEQARALNQVIGTDAAEADEKFEQSHVAMEAALNGLERAIADQVLPTFKTLVDDITSVVTATIHWTQAHPGLTQAALTLAAALAGGGGLLVAVGGLAYALPLLATAFEAAGGPVTLLAGLVATLAVHLYEVRDQVIPALEFAFSKIIGFAADAVGLADKFAVQGSAVDQLHTKLVNLQKSYDDASNAGYTAAASSDKHTEAVKKEKTEVDGAVGAHEKLTAEQKKLQAATDSLVDSVNGETLKDQALEPALKKLLDQHVSMSTIYDTLGPQIDKYVEKITDEDGKLPPLTQKIYDANQARQAELTLQIAQKAEYTTMNAARDTEVQGLITVNQHTMLYDDSITNLTTDVHALFIEYGLVKDQQDSLDGIMKQSLATMDLMGQSIGVINGHFYDTHAQWVQFQNLLGQPAPQVFIGSIDSAITVFGKHTTETLQQATNEVKNSAGKVFDDMFVKGQNVFTSLGNALKGGALSIGRSIFEDVVGYLGGPLKKGFDDFFTGLLDSTGLKSFLTGLGNKLGGLLSSIGLGSGSSTPGVSVGGGAGMSGALKGGLITAGIGAAIAVGEELYKKFTELGRDKSTFVQQYQNPFGQNLGQIVDQFNAARLTGQLTVSDATTTLNSVKTLIGNFESNIADWMKKGGDYATVATRAQATMDANFGPNFSTLLESMQTNIDQRQGVIDDPVKDNTKSTDDNTKSVNDLTNALTSYDPSACTCNAIDSTINSLKDTVKSPVTAGGPTFGTNPMGGITADKYGTAISAMMGGGSQNSYGMATAAQSAPTHNGTAISTPNGTIYLNAQQLNDLQNSGGSYTTSSNYNNIISGAVAGTDLGTNVFYSPGFVSGLTAAQKSALGIGSYAKGGTVPYDQIALVHKGERISPAGGGGGDIIVNMALTVQTFDSTGVEASVMKMIPVFINKLRNNGGGEKDRLRAVLGGD